VPYPEIVVDVILSPEYDDENDDRTLGQDDPKDEDKPMPGSIPVVDDGEASGKVSSATFIPDLVLTGACRNTAPLVTDQAKAVGASLPSSSGAQVCKCPNIVAK
jgi:hypothetical protein